MKLATFEVSSPTGRTRRIGVKDGEELIDLTQGYAALLKEDGEQSPMEVASAELPPNMIEYLERGPRAMEAARTVKRRIPGSDLTEGPTGGTVRYTLDEVNILSPLPRPRSLRDFSVYEDHIAAGFPDGLPDVWYDTPVFYKGNPAEIAHPDADVPWPDYSSKRDYELELGAVIGKRGRNLSPTEADEYIAGYTIFNDFSARDTQFEEMKMNIGPSKGKDFANGLGPYLVTPDSVDITDLEMRALVNGEVVSEGSSAGAQHSWGEIIAHVTDGETIFPGDLLGSGTIGGGSGWENDIWLEPGDTVTLEVEGIGSLTNRIV